MTEITSTPVSKVGSGPPISINIHGAGIGARDRARLFKILEKEITMSTVPVKAAPAKSGWRTTEFWATILMNVGVVAAAATSNLPPRYAAIASAVSVSAYAFSRALAKL